MYVDPRPPTCCFLQEIDAGWGNYRLLGLGSKQLAAGADRFNNANSYGLSLPVAEYTAGYNPTVPSTHNSIRFMDAAWLEGASLPTCM